MLAGKESRGQILVALLGSQLRVKPLCKERHLPIRGIKPNPEGEGAGFLRPKEIERFYPEFYEIVDPVEKERGACDPESIGGGCWAVNLGMQFIVAGVQAGAIQRIVCYKTFRNRGKGEIVDPKVSSTALSGCFPNRQFNRPGRIRNPLA